MDMEVDPVRTPLEYCYRPHRSSPRILEPTPSRAELGGTFWVFVPNDMRQPHSIETTLVELGVDQKPNINVFNKANRVADRAWLTQLVAETPNSVYISARKAQGIPT